MTIEAAAAAPTSTLTGGAFWRDQAVRKMYADECPADSAFSYRETKISSKLFQIDVFAGPELYDSVCVAIYGKLVPTRLGRAE